MLVQILTALVPVLVAIVTIIPTVISNRIKTQTTIEDALKSTDKRIDKMQTALDAHIKEDEDEGARNRRYRILRFYDEICEGKKHSESHFEDILDDIDAYQKYCAKHPDFKNNRGGVAMKRIIDVYGKVKSEGGFLIEKQEG